MMMLTYLKKNETNALSHSEAWKKNIKKKINLFVIWTSLKEYDRANVSFPYGQHLLGWSTGPFPSSGKARYTASQNVSRLIQDCYERANKWVKTWLED